ncbi:MAG: AAA family ATPase [Chlorobi bacterium]|nr:AAA family ATPase [Chlorobiota bacterium]MCI0715373.1 AAA family ATPase [Chlorobiota bacterium]
MITELRLQNFKCFEDYTIRFDKFNLIVGRNNSGKSTIIDALKLVSVLRRYGPYRQFFKFKDGEDTIAACYLEERDVDFPLINIRYNYKDEESIIHAKFTDDNEVKIIFPPEGKPYAIFLKDNKHIFNKLFIRRDFQHSIGVIPPVGTFEEFEKLSEKKYVQSVLISHLTPRNFRNIWYYFPDDFDEFKDLIERTALVIQ